MQTTLSPEYDPRFPWYRCAPGESFFVPSLDVHATVRRGLAQASVQLSRATPREARIGVYAGMLGVLFSVPPRPPLR